MELFTQVRFWLSLVGVVLYLGCLCSLDYPREIKRTLGQEVVGVIKTGFFAVWSWMLIWG
jgi:hypothetical protein